MKWSPTLHGISAIAGIAGLLSLIGAWIAGLTGTVFGLNEAHLFSDANALLLVSIAFGIGTMIHLQEEKNR